MLKKQAGFGLPVAIGLLCLAVFLASPMSSFAGEYVIGEGDTLMVSVWGEKELSRSVKVRPDGRISLPAIGEVVASNVTAADLQTTLTERIRRIVKNPIVTVIVEEVTNNKVYVFGGGVSSGVYSLTQRTTLLQLLCQIGQQQGMAGKEQATTEGSASIQLADLEKSYVVRHEKIIKRDFYQLIVNGKLSDDLVLEPNDAIYIPAVRDRNIYVMGAVATPKSIIYRDGMTAVEAILEAGGFTKFARENGTVIYRNDGDRKITIPVKVKDLINNGDLTQNTRLQPGDYVVVSESLF